MRVCLRLSWQNASGAKGASDSWNLITADLHMGKGHETLNLHRKRSLRRAFILCCLVKGLGVRSSDIVSFENERGSDLDMNRALPDVLDHKVDVAQFFVTFK